jgi:hypothetical protein
MTRESIMATSRKTTPKAKTPKATAAGPKRRTSTRAAKAVAEPDSAAQTRPKLRAVEAAVEPVAAPIEVQKAPKASKGDDAADTRFKRTDLIEAVAERTALKRSDAKVVLELVLEELGKALDHNGELVLPPLGKLSVKRRKPDADGPDILTVKLRRPGPAAAKDGESPLADPDEDG